VRPRGRDNPWLTLAAVALGIMMVALDATVVSVANPTIADDLNASLAGLQWVTNGYLLALAALLIVGGKLGDRFGRKRIFMIGVVGFALTSLLCALAPTIEVLVAARVLQGVTGAMLMPNTLGLLRSAFPPAELNRAVGVWGGASALAIASGPIVGGILVEHVSWQSIFLLNLPLGLITLAATVAWVKEAKDTEHVSSYDLPGVGLLTGGLFTLIWGVIKAQTHGWTSAYVIGFGIAAVVLLTLFALREASTRDPLLPLGLFSNISLSAGVVLVLAGFFALYGVFFFVGLYLQNVHGFSPIQTGVRLLPLTAMFTFSAPLGGLLTEKFGPRLPLCIGMLCLGGASIGLAGLEVGTDYIGQWPFFILIGFGTGMVIVASTQAIVGNAPVERGGLAGGLQSTANQLGGVLGTAVLGSVLASGAGSALAGNLANDGASAATARAVEGQTELVGQGVSPIPPGASPHVAMIITNASDASFISGLHTAMYVSAGVAFAGALIALLVRRGAVPVEAAAAV
jgi:EmrB/QacA subfamily drug resistance transporter